MAGSLGGPGPRSSALRPGARVLPLIVISPVLRPGRPSEARALRALALRSKGFWGYDAEFLARCRNDLAVSPAQIDGRRLVVAVMEGYLAGYVRLGGTHPAGELEALFVDPPWIGRGCGRLLLERAVAIAASEGMTVLRITADPNAQPFYQHAGARLIGHVPSPVIPGRVLPRLELNLPVLPPHR